MAGAIYGSGFVQLKPDLSGFGAAVSRSPIWGAAGTAAATAFAAAFAGVVAAGVAAFKIGDTFDQAFDTIRIGTGATGDDLEGLKGDFKAVAREVPADLGDVSTAVADINTRLGLSGAPLQDLSTQFLELSRLTGSDLAGNIETVSRAFGDWGVEDQAGALDMLFRASQATGPSVDRIGQLVTQYGSPLRQFGFGFAESAALLGKFEKEGVNVELVLGSLRQGLGKLAKTGEDPREALARITDEIKNAGSTSEANQKAIELFGARAGPDMAAAISEGRFELGDLFGAVADGSETILGAAADTESFGQKWQKFKNRVLVAVEPIATRVFEGVGNVFDTVAPKVERLITNVVLPAFDAMGQWWNANGPTITAIVANVFSTLGSVINTIVPVIQTVIGWFRSGEAQSTGAFRNIAAFARETWPKVQAVISGVMEVVRTVIEKVTGAIAFVWDKHGERIMAIVGNVFGAIRTVITTVLDVIKGIIETVMGVLTGDWRRAWEGIKSIVKSVFEGAWDIIKRAFSTLVNLIPILWEGVKAAITTTFNTTVGIMSTAWEDVKGAVGTGIENIKEFFTGLPGKIIGWVGDVTGTLTGAAEDLIAGMVDGVKNTAHKVIDAIKEFVLDKVPDFVKDFFGIKSPSKMMAGFGAELPAGLAVGIRKGASQVDRAVADMSRAVPTTFGANLEATGITDTAGGGVFAGATLEFHDGDAVAIADEIEWRRKTAGV